MFVLPPPPRYPTQAAYNAAVAAGHAAPMVETNNILTNPTGQEYQLLSGEGAYVLKDDLQLAIPPPHPSDPQIIDVNPLSTKPRPITTGTKVSLVTLSSRPTAPMLYKVGTNLSTKSGLQSPIAEHPNENRSSISSDDLSSITNSLRSPLSLSSSAPAFGSENPNLNDSSRVEGKGKDKDKKKKPKNNIAKSNSSFISRALVNENLQNELKKYDPMGYFAFANVNRSFQWLDTTSATKQDHLTKILFAKAHCLCHDANQVTKSLNHIDLVMGFTTGEIIWYEPIAQKYTRLNKNGVINPTPVSQIRWIPGSENLFMAAHMDGRLVVYDKEKEDASFVSDLTTSNDPPVSPIDGTENPTAKYRISIQKSVHSHHQKVNPVACWKLSNQKINSFAFSPDNRLLAVVAVDGGLKIIDYLNERLLDIFPSYYGAFTCVCWSPDAKYIVTGGEDDLLSIWSVADRSLVARCKGHRSWLADIAFDPWRCDDRGNYRFGSAGQDTRLLLWDFSVGMLTIPKASSVRHRPSVSSKYAGNDALGRTQTQSSALSNGLQEDRSEPVKHSVMPKKNVPVLVPVFNKQVHKDPLAWLAFTEEAILTSCVKGHIRTWTRPKDMSKSLVELNLN